MQPMLFTAIGAMVALALAAGVADHRRRHRADLDRIGWADWPMVQMLAFLAAAVLVIVALNA